MARSRAAGSAVPFDSAQGTAWFNQKTAKSGAIARSEGRSPLGEQSRWLSGAEALSVVFITNQKTFVGLLSTFQNRGCRRNHRSDIA